MWQLNACAEKGLACLDRETQAEAATALDAETLDFLHSAEGEGPNVGITNGRFDITDPGNEAFYWALRGDATIASSRGTLVEDDVEYSGFTQTFLIPAGATAIRFSILGLDLDATALQPPDAFEAALLNADTLSSLVPFDPALAEGDPGGTGYAFLNIQATGEIYYGSTTTLSPTVNATGQVSTLTFPTVVTVSLTGIAVDTKARLDFDLLGFGALDSSVSIDTITILGADAPPLTAELTDATDSGPNDRITNISPVTIFGTTDPLAAIAIDTDTDGLFDDGAAVADVNGNYTVSGVALASGVNPVRVRAGVPIATTIVPLSITYDIAGPTPTLVAPLPGASVVDDPGFIEIIWADPTAGVDTSTYSIDDVTITGVDVDVIFQPDPANPSRVQYFYDRDGEFLPSGNIAVNFPAGKVFDRAGNSNLASSASFRLLLNLEAGLNISTPLGTPASLNGASFRYDGLHSLLTLTIDWGDGTPVQTVPLTGTSGGGPINASHNYANYGLYSPLLRLRDNLGREMTDTVTVAEVRPGCSWQNPLKRLDVSGDTLVSPLDAVLIINDLNARGPRVLPNPPISPDVPPPFLDVTCDNFVGPSDAVEVINALNSGTGGEGERALANDAFDEVFASEAQAEQSVAGPDYLSALAWLDAEVTSRKASRTR